VNTTPRWARVPLKRLADVIGGATPRTEEPDFWDGEVVWVTPVDIGKSGSLFVDTSDRTLTYEGLSSCSAELLPTGSVILSTRAPIGAVGIARVPLATNQGCKGLIIREGDPRFFAYQLTTLTDVLNSLGSGSTFLELSADRLKNFPMVRPPLDEQRAIADFLDRETATIDALIAKQEELVAVLREERSAAITAAVTGSLRVEDSGGPQGRGSVASVVYDAYTESGTQWLGEVPAHWGLRPLGYFFRERKTVVSDKEFQPLSVSKSGIVPQLETAAKTDNGDNRKLVRVGDFVINSRSDRKGSAGLSALEGSVSVISTVLEPRYISGRYAHYLLRSEAFQEEFYRFGTGIVADLWSTRYSAMKLIIVPSPPLDEQRAIANYLDEQTAKIDALITKSRTMIDTLREYRAALITDAVTGKIDVRKTS